MSKKLLLADDSVVIQKLVGLSFANEDFEIVSTDNGDDAVSMAREIQPDVVLADVVMPGLSGYEVCEAIRQDPTLAQTPVLLLTGTFEAFDEDRASEAGANGHITKPFEAQALVERVNEVMSAPAAASETPAAPAETVIEATAKPAPPVADADETIVISPGSTPQSADLFDSNDGALGSDAASSDSFERPAGDETPVEPLPTAHPVDLDAGLDAVPIDEEPTILVAHEDINATTSPNLWDPLADLYGGPPTGGFEDSTVQAPSAGIDQDDATATTPDVTADTTASTEATRVADLDAAFADEPVVADDTGVAVGPTTSDPLGLAPASASADDMDFAFDVFEQVAADQSQSANRKDEAPFTPAPAPLESASEKVAAGYDVSSSDLATAPDSAAEATPQPVPESEPLIEVPELPQAYQPKPASVADADPITGSLDLFDDLSTGSPLDELQSFDEAQPLDEALPFNAFSSAGDLEVDDDLLAPDLSIDLGDDLDTGEEESVVMPVEVPEADEAFSIGSAPSEPDADRPIADLSPIMEQRIQETLEKVAWEAFSDLSESIVKQVIGRVEEIAWEVIPEMAETLVREEIRKMKREAD